MANDRKVKAPRAKQGFHLLKGDKDLRARYQLCDYCGRAYHTIDKCNKLAEKNRRVANNLCVYCGEDGHKKPECPKLNPSRRQRNS